MSALDTMKSALQCSKTEAAKLRIRVRQLEEKLVEVAAIGEQEADKLRQGSEFLVAENARLVAALRAARDGAFEKIVSAELPRLAEPFAKYHEEHARYGAASFLRAIIASAEDAPRGAK